MAATSSGNRTRKPRKSTRKSTRRKSPAKKTAARTGNKRGHMDDAHKKALAAGRTESRHINKYLKAIDANRPRRGRRVSVEELDQRLQKVKDQIASASPGLERLKLIQEREALAARIENESEGVDLAPLEAEFVKYAKSYSERNQISRKVWREMGVEADVLAKAGVK